MFAGRRRQILILAGGALAVVAAGLALWRWTGRYERAQVVHLEGSPPVPTRRLQPQVRLAVAPVWGPERTIDNYYALSEYLSGRIGHPVLIVQRKTYGEVNELLRHERVQVAVICTGAYLAALGDDLPLEIIAAPAYPSGPIYRSLLVVRSDSQFEDLDDLHGRAFGFSDPLSLTGYYYPWALLLRAGKDPNTYFGRTVFTYSHDGSMRAVLDGIVDGAAVDSILFDDAVERHPATANQLRVIHRSPAYGVSPVVVTEAIDPTLRVLLKRAFLTMDRSEEGRQALASLGMEGFVDPPPGLYDDAAGIVEDVQKAMVAVP